jgi:hypothetical protein
LIPPNVPESKRELLSGLVELLAAVSGVRAVVLGGSYARGRERPDSDLDIGIYYENSRPFQIEEIRAIAAGLSVQGTPLVTNFYEWGPWVNGGAWVHTQIGKIDFLYRNIDQVQKTIEDAQAGTIEIDFNQQPPYGFFSVIYLAETHQCVALHDPHGVIAAMKERVQTYPPRLKEKLVADDLWLVEFTLLHARDFAGRGDVYNTAGCLTRAAAYLTQVLFAINETYFISDKSALEEIDKFSRTVDHYSEKVQSLLGNIGCTSTELGKSVARMEWIWKSVVDLPDHAYHPKFVI